MHLYNFSPDIQNMILRGTIPGRMAALNCTHSGVPFCKSYYLPHHIARQLTAYNNRHVAASDAVKYENMRAKNWAFRKGLQFILKTDNVRT